MAEYEKFTNRKGKIRFYDGTGTPFYLEIPFDGGDASFPTGRPLPELIPVLSRGVKDANSHYIRGSEEAYLEGLDVSFSLLTTELTKSQYAEDWVAILNGKTPATINSNTILTTKGSTQNDGSNDNPEFPDASSRLTLDIEYLLDGPTTDKGYKLAEVYFPHGVLNEGDDSVVINLSGKIYGTITAITAFTAGTDVTA